MPSAASNVKVEKQIGDTALADNSTPLRQAITIIEHKIRNLEKRKSKLESYKELQNAGKTLNEDQKTAVAKFNEVIQTLEFARDLSKQFMGLVNVSEKDAKKQAKREAALKNQQELARLREILLVQDALNQMGSESVRDDFLNGKNGAAQLTESDLKLLDDLYPAVTPKHEAGNPTAFTNEVQAAAEHLLAVVDGKQKEVFGGTYCQIKEVLGKIHESGYFDQAQVFETYVETEVAAEQQDLTADAPQQPQSDQLPPAAAAHDLTLHQLPIESLTLDGLSQQQQQQPQPMHVAGGQVPPPMQQAPPPHAVLEQPPTQQVIDQLVGAAPVGPDKLYHQGPPPQVQAVPQQQPPPPRPISEVLGAGSFFFLQESEIDPQPDQIPSQTFTNQSFVSGIHLPPTMALPPHFQAPLANLPPTLNNLPPQPQPQQPQTQQPPQQPQVPVGVQKNGGGMLVDERDAQFGDEVQNNVNLAHNNGKFAPRNQNFYQNNGYKGDFNNKDFKDGYNNRPRQTRNGNARPQTRH